jgi:hypothetical protein
MLSQRAHYNKAFLCLFLLLQINRDKTNLLLAYAQFCCGEYMKASKDTASEGGMLDLASFVEFARNYRCEFEYELCWSSRKCMQTAVSSLLEVSPAWCSIMLSDKPCHQPVLLHTGCCCYVELTYMSAALHC